MMTEEDREAETKIVPVGPQYVQANQGIVTLSHSML